MVFHLDREVENQSQKSIKELFEKRGENFFRDCEIRCFSSIVERHKDKNLVIDVGAGFKGEKPKDFKALWLQRSVNLSKAFFPDRPKLDVSHEISKKRFEKRQKHYQSIADYELELPEDKFGDEVLLKKIFTLIVFGNSRFYGKEKNGKSKSNQHTKSFFKKKKDLSQFRLEFPVSQEWKVRKNSNTTNLYQSHLNIQSFIKEKKQENPNQTSPLENLWFLTKLHDSHKSFIFPNGKNKNFSNKENQMDQSGLRFPGFQDWKIGANLNTINRQWELRNDLLSFSTIQKLFKKHPRSLISFRTKRELKKLENLLAESSLWDWPLEWGFNNEAKILSLHKRREDLVETLNQLPCEDQVIKLAVPIENFFELQSGYQWFLENPEKRIFLPISPNGRWKWFRLLTGGQMPFGFFREGRGSSPDQPTLVDLLNHHFHRSSFAAIIGSPVKHSLTPSFHRRFFAKKQMNCLAIDVLKEEWEQAFTFLDKMGLKAAAVTSPLKKKAGEWTGKSSSTINTLFKSKEKWLGASTDEKGFKKLITGNENKKVVVWGGGDLLDLIKKFFPRAVFYSSRTGQPKEGQKNTKPDIIIWAVGPENFRKKGVYPPQNWKPKKVIDLNYNIDSQGSICAHRYGSHYQSGLVMFTEQAKEQQKFWSQS